MTDTCGGVHDYEYVTLVRIDVNPARAERHGNRTRRGWPNKRHPRQGARTAPRRHAASTAQWGRRAVPTDDWRGSRVAAGEPSMLVAPTPTTRLQRKDVRSGHLTIRQYTFPRRGPSRIFNCSAVPSRPLPTVWPNPFTDLSHERGSPAASNRPMRSERLRLTEYSQVVAQRSTGLRSSRIGPASEEGRLQLVEQHGVAPGSPEHLLPVALDRAPAK